ncbi:GNAT family N-acetyltransferase [Metabacillus litoralis]|uniref:GNAT family N-acetyltransferase n=1 Tax=Metabacillus litoralis TaxID=152268 RepID=UPI00203BD353|nr:GNAT family N-acetyltransferase [Metabacillus litoralis]
MGALEFVCDYKEKDDLRHSFNELANSIFGITFESWYENGFWTEKYIPFSYTDGNKVVANVSVNLMNMLINGETKRGIQIGTVMTHPDYRNKGLSKRLMIKVLEKYEDSYDIMYLFANHSVLDFYPKFGFKRIEETQFISNIVNSHHTEIESTDFKRLDGKNINDLQFIYQFAKNRLPISNEFAVMDTAELLLFYCQNAFPNDIYYLEEEQVIVIFKITEEENELHIYDVISQKEIDLLKIVKYISVESTKKIYHHFTVDGLHTEKKTFNGSEVLFIRCEKEMNLPKELKHPLTSQA